MANDTCVDAPVFIGFRPNGHDVTGVTGMPGAQIKATSTRYESNIIVSGGLSGRFRGSIFPDNMNVKGHLVDGDYDIYLGFHTHRLPKESDLVVRTSGFRAVLVVNANRSVPVDSNNPSKMTSNGIHIHNGWHHWKAAKPMSEGCLLIHPNDWWRFILLFLDGFPGLENWSNSGSTVGLKIGRLSVKAPAECFAQ